MQLDAGVAEQVLLQSRDERSLLVMSYADIKVGLRICIGRAKELCCIPLFCLQYGPWVLRM